MATTIIKMTKKKNFGQFFPVSWALKLVFELRKIPEILGKYSPPGLFSAVQNLR